MNQHSPATFTAYFNTTVGGFSVFVNRTWAPHGADRFYNLVRLGFFNDTGLFRVLPGFVIEWGLSGNPALSQVYCNDVTCPNFVPGAAISPDQRFPGAPLNAQPGTVAYSLMDGGAKGLVNASTEIFINLGSNPKNDQSGFIPFGVVTDGGMKVIKSFYSGYGELNETDVCPTGRSRHTGKPCAGPTIAGIVKGGNTYLKAGWPKMDFVTAAAVH
jgi:peptidyl-prolyl cis-trans isomerase A (cyclophilin A)